MLVFGELMNGNLLLASTSLSQRLIEHSREDFPTRSLRVQAGFQLPTSDFSMRFPPVLPNIHPYFDGHFQVRDRRFHLLLDEWFYLFQFVFWNVED